VSAQPEDTRTADPGGLDVERLARALNAAVGGGWLRSTPSDPVAEWRMNAEAVAAEYAARLTPEATAPDAREYHGHEQEVCEPCWKAGHDVGDTRTADPGGLREAVAAHVACVCAALTGGEGPRPLGNGNWYHFQGCCADSDLALTPEATAPDEEGAKP
jgi:hypothetical protein